MTKKDLVAHIADAHNLTLTNADALLSDVFETISDSLASGEVFQWPDFGRFNTKPRAGRQGRNPSTGEALTIAATTVVQFKPAATLKDRVHALTDEEK